MSVTVYIPRDTTANALGAEAVVAALNTEAQRRNETVEVVRNGSRGMCWLEPLVEIVTEQGRIAYGPVAAADIPALIDAGMLESGANQPAATHPLCRGLTEQIPYLAQQQRLTFSRAGVTDPLSLDDYRSHQGFQGLERALALSPQAIVDEVKESGLRGRGGAAFPAGIKWQTVLDAPIAPNQSEQKYIVCNADEGDSGTFADRLVMEADPYMLIEGMCIAGLAVGATQGYIYLRSEYPLAQQVLNQAIETAQTAGYLGDNICNSGRAFHLEVRLGAGAYICGEETSLLESLEGKRGLVRAKPPLPALVGLFGQPTVVNNVLTLAAIPYILDSGAKAYADYGCGRSRGTLAFQLAGNINQGGLVELAFGTTLEQLLQQFGNGTASGRPMHAIQVGGPLGAYLPQSQWKTALDYEAFTETGAVLGHGGIVVFDDSVDMMQQARFAMEFCAVESCGKCTPCRIGSTRGVEVIDRLTALPTSDQQQQNDKQRNDTLELLHDLCDTMEDGSLCAMGGMTPNPVRSALKYFNNDLNSASGENTDA